MNMFMDKVYLTLIPTLKISKMFEFEFKNSILMIKPYPHFVCADDSTYTSVTVETP